MRLLAWHFSAAGNSPIFTCPPDCVTLVKDALVYNSGSTPATVNVQIGGGGFNLILIQATALAGQAYAQWEGWAVLNPGEYVFSGADGAGPVIWVSGAVLLGPPPFPPGEQAEPLVFLNVPVVLP